MDKLIYSNTVNLIGETEVTLWSIWRDAVLVGLAKQGDANTKSWLKPGEIIQIDGHRWAMLNITRAEEPGHADFLLHLLAVE